MVMICRSVENRLIEGWNDDQLSELEAGRGDSAAKPVFDSLMLAEAKNSFKMG